MPATINCSLIFHSALADHTSIVAPYAGKPRAAPVTRVVEFDDRALLIDLLFSPNSKPRVLEGHPINRAAGPSLAHPCFHPARIVTLPAVVDHLPGRLAVVHCCADLQVDTKLGHQVDATVQLIPPWTGPRTRRVSV